MSPTKRSNEELEAAAEASAAAMIDNNNDNNDDNNDNNQHDTTGAPSPPKRIRGGGGGTAAVVKDELFDEELVDMDMAADRDEFIPDNVDSNSNNTNDNDTIVQASKSKWVRPPLPKGLNNKTDLNVQWLDIDMVTAKPLTKNPNRSKSRVVGNISGQNVPVIRVFGVNEGGHSATVFIHGFTPYAYFALPSNYPAAVFSDPKNSAKIRTSLNDRLRLSARGEQLQQYVLGVEFLPDHKSIMGYETNHTQFLKVHLAVPTLIPTLKRIMSEGVHLGVSFPGCPSGETCYEPFECNVPFVLRYMIDKDITGAGWLTLPEKTYQFRPEKGKQTHCQMEVDVSYDDIIARKSEGEWNKIAPIRILSFDIECQGRKGHFPEAEKDPVIQIANTVTVYGDDKPTISNVFTLKGCLPIVGAQVIPSDEEEDMLMKWRAFLELADPDIITGYNVQNFDIPYLLDRANALAKTGGAKAKSKLANFSLWGRVKNSRAKMKDTMFQSSAYGRRANVETTIEGRVIFDMLPYMQRNHKLSSYTLNSVCSEYLGQQKEDVHHSIISDLQNGSDEDRHRLAVYCLKDALLPQRLMDKLSVLVNYIEMARVTGVPMSFLISRGQQIKVFSMILRKCKGEKLLVPTLAKSGNAGSEVGYEGATVLDPIKKYYKDPIATLDFASLYPSIMQAWNLCYSTLISPTDLNRVDEKLYKTSENGHTFVHTSVKKGILPTILEELLTARKRAKKDMKNASTEFERTVQNGRQLALKVSANSVYGFTGAIVGHLPCLPIASSTTSYGRYLLERTKEFVEDTYTVANGYEHNAIVIYGDTDSVMVKFGTSDLSKAFRLAEEAAEQATKIFPSPISLEFEKVYYPYLLMNKKRYAGLMWTREDKYDKMDTKGLETVRRDNCALVRDLIQTSLNTILIDKDVEGAIKYVKSQISDLLQNKMDISQLVITKSLNKGAEYALGLGGKKEDYKMKQAHVELAARMRKRDAGSAPQMGDRVPYVIITGAKGAANFEKAEDPIYALENNLPLDCKWYLSNQLSKPLTRIFEPIIGDVEKNLLQGDHTRKIFIPTPSARKGSLMMFAVKTATCVGCKVGVDAKEGFLCKHCLPKEAEIYLKKLAVMQEAELRYADLWAAAQRIHGTVHSDIMCTGDGCACQFYRRKKVQADLKLAQEVLDKFGR